MHRRRFLAQLTTVSALATVSSLRAQTANTPAASTPPAPETPLTFSAGEGRRFTWVDQWLRPPQGLFWGETHGLAQDSNGFIYVAHTVGPASRRDDAVVVFDEQGNFVRSFGGDFRGGAHGLDLRREADGEFLYHCDVKRSRVVKTALDGRVLWSRGYPEEAPSYRGDAPYVPTNVAFHPDGGLFVADGYGSNRILHYAADGAFVREIGHPGKGDGEFVLPHGLIVDQDGGEPRLFVADRTNRRVQVFSLDGEFVRIVPNDGRLRLPCDFNRRGDLLVCPDLDSQVCVLDASYRVIASLGDGRAHNGKLGSKRAAGSASAVPGQFICPHDALVLRNGDILVAEYVPWGRITLLRRET